MGSFGAEVEQGSQVVRSDVRIRCKGPVLKNRPNESVGLHVVEAIPPDMPPPLGKDIDLRMMVDSDHAAISGKPHAAGTTGSEDAKPSRRYMLPLYD